MRCDCAGTRDFVTECLYYDAFAKGIFRTNVGIIILDSLLFFDGIIFILSANWQIDRMCMCAHVYYALKTKQHLYRYDKFASDKMKTLCL